MPLVAPNLTDFTAFLFVAGTSGIPTPSAGSPVGVGGVPGYALSTTDPVIQMALNVAVDIVNTDLTFTADIYTLAVYNLATDNVYRFAQDTPSASRTPPLFFEAMREKLGLNNFTAGVVASSGDEGTSVSLLNTEAMKNLTLMDLQNLKTPWGRQYLYFAQMMGPTVIGLS